MNRFTALIQKQYLLNYSDEQEFQEVLREFLLKYKEQEEDQYIQDIYYKLLNFMITYFFQQQAEVLY